MAKIDAGAKPAARPDDARGRGGRRSGGRLERGRRPASATSFRMPRLGRRGLLAALGVVLLGWLATSIYRVQPDEQGVVLRFGHWVATTEPGLHVHLPFPIETVLLPKVTQINQIQLGVGPSASARPPSRPRRADADRRREHRRGRLRRVLEDPRRGQVPVQGRRSRARREDRRRGRAARRHQPHADPGRDVRQAPADRRRDARRCCRSCSTTSRRASRSPRFSCSASSRRSR